MPEPVLKSMPAAASVRVRMAGTPAVAAVLTFGELAVGDDYLDATGAVAVASFKKLDGTINFGGKSFDLGSVDYSTAVDGATARGLLNTAAKAPRPHRQPVPGR